MEAHELFNQQIHQQLHENFVQQQLRNGRTFGNMTTSTTTDVDPIDFDEFDREFERRCAELDTQHATDVSEIHTRHQQRVAEMNKNFEARKAEMFKRFNF